MIEFSESDFIIAAVRVNMKCEPAPKSGSESELQPILTVKREIASSFLEWKQTLSESLILAQDERWRRA